MAILGIADEIAAKATVQPDFAEELAKSGKISTGDRPIIAHVGVGLGNRKDSPMFDISTVEKLRKTLLGADLLVFNSVKSGEAFAKVLARLGIAETLKSKIVRTAPNGIFVPVLNGKGNDMVAGTIPLIATTPGIKLLGPLPGNLQSSLTYTGVVMANTSQRDTARTVHQILGVPEGQGDFRSERRSVNRHCLIPRWMINRARLSEPGVARGSRLT